MEQKPFIAYASNYNTWRCFALVASARTTRGGNPRTGFALMRLEVQTSKDFEESTN